VDRAIIKGDGCECVCTVCFFRDVDRAIIKGDGFFPDVDAAVGFNAACRMASASGESLFWGRMTAPEEGREERTNGGRKRQMAMDGMNAATRPRLTQTHQIVHDNAGCPNVRFHGKVLDELVALRGIFDPGIKRRSSGWVMKWQKSRSTILSTLWRRSLKTKVSSWIARWIAPLS